MNKNSGTLPSGFNTLRHHDRTTARPHDRMTARPQVSKTSDLRTLFASLLLALSLCGIPAAGQEQAEVIISAEKSAGSLALVSAGSCAPLCVSPGDWPGVMRALTDLQNDLSRVTGTMPELITGKKVSGADVIIIAGTIGKSALVDRLVRKRRIDVSDIAGKWESYLIEAIDRPFPGVRKAIVIAGSDRRGTIYGIYEISRQIGVSPWHWWADVPVRKSDELYLNPGRYVAGEPSVKYRGIFLNDEYPALTRWVSFRYGDVKPSDDPPIPPGVANYGSEFYSRIFELLLRLKANYLWPAMWNNAFNEDDPRNAALADDYGIVMGTSHQEPMIRAQKEWDRRYKNTLGYWSWSDHADTLVKFWRDGIRRNRDFESIVTIGLRGADDTEMGPGGPAANIARLEKIVDVQRNIIAEEINPDVTRVPQMWCLYKEVQDYYYEGMRVPDDVTLLWAEDNWGNVRRLPTADERRRNGSAGVYYHFDYHGGPRSYQWINTSPIPKIWDQMSLARQYGADRIWIVNVGHFRGYEVPIEYFLSLAWDTEAFSSDAMSEWTSQWAASVFGPDYAPEIADIISRYTRYNGRRKPELLRPDTYSLVNYNEAERIVEEYKSLSDRAEAIGQQLPEEMKDAYFHLVLFPVKACALVNELYVTAGKNTLYAAQGRSMTSAMADRTEELFRADTALMGYYNRVYAEGRWKHFMDQAHLGYVAWNDPPVNSLRHIRLARPDIPAAATPAVAVEGSQAAWPVTAPENSTKATPEALKTGSTTQGSPGEVTAGSTDQTSPASCEAPLLPQFDLFNKQTRYFEIFNRGNIPFDYTVTTGNPWITLSHTSGRVTDQQRVTVSVDWPMLTGMLKAASSSVEGSGLTGGLHEGTVTVSAAGGEIKIVVPAFCPTLPDPADLKGFVEGEGYVSMEAASYTSRHDTEERNWEWIEDYGRTHSGMRATAVTDAPPAQPGKDAPWLEYRIYLFSSGDFETTLYMAPSLNFLPDRDFRIGLSVDDGEPQPLTVVPKEFNAENGNREWEETVRNSTRYVSGKITITEPGYHILKVWMIDPGMVLEKIVVNTGGLRPSYLGPPESHFGQSAVLSRPPAPRLRWLEAVSDH
ncbi:MAG: glycosyl hydrolase 115 family protein [Bacteroidales bacterium]|nr:glycosyl hydrolase 115 family protein [Bacteroidales bacterium]MDT8374314.1 glycosyl hydrolase 115 family protein [Bacteroidales bacterium]